MKPRLPGWRRAIIETLVCGALLVLLAILLHPLSAVDSVLTAWINDLPRNLQPSMQDITLLGEVPTLIGVAGIWAIFELVRRRRDRAIAMATSLASLPLFYLIKETVARARPISKLAEKAGFHGYSFPSGHATGSAAVYGVLAFMIARALPGPWNRIVSGIAIMLVILIGISRVYLGAHFPTDVLGGWLVGLAVYNLIATQQRRQPAEVTTASEDPE